MQAQEVTHSVVDPMSAVAALAAKEVGSVLQSGDVDVICISKSYSSLQSSYPLVLTGLRNGEAAAWS